MTRPMRFASFGLLVLTAFSLGACRLPRESPSSRHWILTPIEGTRSSGEIGHTVGVGPVEFPSYLERPNVVRRIGANQLNVAAFELWGQSLPENFSGVLGRNLQLLVPGLATVSFPWKGAGQDLAYRLALQVERFDVGPDDQVALDAVWALHGGGSKKSFAAGEHTSIRIPVEGEGYAAIVAAMSQALGVLSREIAPHLEGGR